MARTWMVELKHFKIRVHVFKPGPIDNPEYQTTYKFVVFQICKKGLKIALTGRLFIKALLYNRAF